MASTELIYDWNKAGPFQFRAGRRVTLANETLRDGLQNPPFRDAFRAATAVHAAVIIKACRAKQPGLPGAVYSGVPAHGAGMEQIIEIRPVWGRPNVTYWLEKHGIAISGALVDRILEAARKSDRVLTEAEIRSPCGVGGPH